jgi:ubiquitin carboxyl-terminal hydrolase 10
LETAKAQQSTVVAVSDTPAMSETKAEEASRVMTNGHTTQDAVNGETTSPDAGEASTKDEHPTAEQTAPTASLKAIPTSWANLFSKSASSHTAVMNDAHGDGASLNGNAAEGTTAGVMPGSNFSETNRSVLAEAIREFKVDSTDRAALIEPRGLVNTGNMCYMNAVCFLPLQPKEVAR